MKIHFLPNKTFSRRNSNLKDRMVEENVAEHMFCPIGKVGSSFLLYRGQQNFPFGLPVVGKHSNGSDLKSPSSTGDQRALDIPFREEEVSEICLGGGIGKCHQ